MLDQNETQNGGQDNQLPPKGLPPIADSDGRALEEHVRVRPWSETTSRLLSLLQRVAENQCLALKILAKARPEDEDDVLSLLGRVCENKRLALKILAKARTEDEDDVLSLMEEIVEGERLMLGIVDKARTEDEDDVLSVMSEITKTAGGMLAILKKRLPNGSAPPSKTDGR